MTYDLYLELKQEDIILVNQSAMIGVDEEDEEPEQEAPQTEDATESTPLYFYRNPMDDCVKLEVDFDPRQFEIIHLVFVRYYEVLGDGGAIPKWDIAGTFPSRRLAKDRKSDIEKGDYIDGRWMGENSTVEEVEIYSLPVEE